MHNRCGLVHQANPCRCPKKTKGFIAKGWVDPNNLKWQLDYQQKISDLSERRIEETLLTVDDLYARLYRDHPFKISKKAESIVQEIMGNSQLGDVFKLGD